MFESEERQHSPSVFQVAGASRTGQVADFCYLSNKFFPSPEMIAALAEGFEDLVRNYPSMQEEQRRLVGNLTGYEPAQILVGNGASELIHLVAARLGKRWLMPCPSYMEYENVIRDFKRELHLLLLRESENFEVDVGRVLEEMDAHKLDAVVFPNPNSPTGQKIPEAGLRKLLDNSRHLEAVVIDESFIEFTSPDRAAIPTVRNLLDEFPNLIIIRSLGKDFGACGLRLGLMATANRKWLDEIRRFLPVWNISPLAEKFVRLCLDRRADYEKARVACIQETQSLAKRLSDFPQLKVFPTASNFILFKILDERCTSTQMRDCLLSEEGLYVRDCSRKQGLSNKFIRVGTNLPAENSRLVDAIGRFFARFR